jgi:hypothetical protein
MRLKRLIFAALCSFGWSCSSSTDEGAGYLQLLDYALAEVDGEAIPGPLSSLPGLWLWEGIDGTVLTVAKGELTCNANGTAEERYLFRLAQPGSAIWDPIRVKIDHTCELVGSGNVRFRDRDTGEVLDGTVMERFDGCTVISKKLPSVESLRRGYVSSNSEAPFPAELAFPSQLEGQFLDAECADW